MADKIIQIRLPADQWARAEAMAEKYRDEHERTPETAESIVSRLVLDRLSTLTIRHEEAARTPIPSLGGAVTIEDTP